MSSAGERMIKEKLGFQLESDQKFLVETFLTSLQKGKFSKHKL